MQGRQRGAGMSCMDTVTFLLVEDDDLDVEIVKRAFSKLKLANPIVRAVDGIDALDHLRGTGDRQKIEGDFIILLDINMPRMNGLEFLEELRSDPELRRSVVFVLTTSESEKDIFRAYDLHISGYVLKGMMGTSLDDALKMLNAFWKVVVLPKK